eukprot:gene13284-14654_t
MSTILKDRKLSMALKIRVLQCFIWLVLLYGSELEDLSLGGKVPGRKARGRQRLLYLNQIKEYTGLKTTRDVWDAARSRKLKPS